MALFDGRPVMLKFFFFGILHGQYLVFQVYHTLLPPLCMATYVPSFFRRARKQINLQIVRDCALVKFCHCSRNLQIPRAVTQRPAN
jgi:hypothetical protein